MSSNFFSRKIKCKVCGYNFRKINDRKIVKYIDGGYVRKASDCTRNAIEEKVLLETIERYCFKNEIEYREDKQFIRDLVERIEVDGDTIKIIYKNKDFSIITPNLVKI